MKQFFEQYGGVALGILALIVLIAMITPVGNIIKTSLQGTTETFSSKMNAQTDTMSEQMSDIMNTAGEFLNVKEDGKMYKGDELYTGWNGDKAYLNGEEQTLITDAYSGPKAILEGIADRYEPYTHYSYLKIDGKVVAENFDQSLQVFLPPIAIGVSTIEILVHYPSIYRAEFRNANKLINPEFTVLKEEEDFTTARIYGIINACTSYGDISADDINLYLK